MGQDSNLQPTTEFKSYKRNLPHLEDPGYAYFVTFRTIEGLSLCDEAKDIVFSSILFHAGKKYRLCGCVVMSTHVHMVLQPLEERKNQFYSLARITHSIKSYSANRIQRRLGHCGSVWLDENYDRAIRDDEDCEEKMNYLIYNPVKAGLVSDASLYRWLFYEGSA